MEYIQKHISIPVNFMTEIESKMQNNGQKLSPLCNALLKKYFNSEGSS